MLDARFTESALVHIGDNAKDGRRDDWKTRLGHSAKNVSSLVVRGVLSPDEQQALETVEKRHKTFVSDYYLNLIDPDDSNCPIRLQAIPHIDELDDDERVESDPTGDNAHRVNQALIHRYPNRVLLTPTHICPMYCRYCFRKVALNDGQIRYHKAVPQALEYIEKKTEISEVILSGGDPLILSNQRLGALIEQLVSISHVRRIRIHTRMPVTFPYRIDQEFIRALGRPQQIYLVSHFNHPRELTPLAISKLEMMRDSGFILANQSVLLKGVNDAPKVLAELYNELGYIGVRPYYLHHLDPAPGTAHFRVSLRRGKRIYRKLLKLLSGPDRPRYVIEVPGGGGKVDVDSDAVVELEQPGLYRMMSPLNDHPVHWVDPSAE
ncbi:MAG: KamA family radical SAM protein [Myxococcota bacterium]|nr:KamA family radical SAM protein [Myxococcota bacterium]